MRRILSGIVPNRALGWKLGTTAKVSRNMSDERQIEEALRLLAWAKEELDKHKVNADNWFADYEAFLRYDIKPNIS